MGVCSCFLIYIYLIIITTRSETSSGRYFLHHYSVMSSTTNWAYKQHNFRLNSTLLFASLPTYGAP